MAIEHKEMLIFNLFIDGEFKGSIQKKYFNSINPSSGEIIAQLADAQIDDLKLAISSARKAFDDGSWKNFSMAERGIYLKKIAKLIRDNAKELAQLESLDAGKTSKQSTFIDVPTCADTFEYFSNVSEVFNDRINPVDAPVKSITQYEPIGVIGIIIPWNYPLIMAAWKIAPALMAGNTIVFKPSPLASVSIMKLMELIERCGLPKGVLNVITTTSKEAAEELIKSEDVNMISFTGGTETGQRIMTLASGSIKKVSLELGGKSPNIVFADCDQEAALGGTMSAIFMNQGQMCTAGSRLFIEERIYDQFLKQLIEKTTQLRIGDALDYQTSFGPLISKGHRDSVLKFIEEAIKEGAKLECGGRIPQGQSLRNGFYFEPTILSGVTNNMKAAQEEVFGPVLSVMKFSNIDEVIEKANDSKYGLAACIWTKDLDKANKVAKRLQTGTVWINTYGGFYNEASFGGYKQSGFGRDLGIEGLLEFSQTKHVCIDQTPGGKSLVSSWF